MSTLADLNEIGIIGIYGMYIGLPKIATGLGRVSAVLYTCTCLHSLMRMQDLEVSLATFLEPLMAARCSGMWRAQKELEHLAAAEMAMALMA